MKVGRSIKICRRLRGLKQHELAKIIGISQNSISQIERGVTQPHKKTLEAICKALETSESQMILSTFTDEELINELSSRLKRK